MMYRSCESAAACGRGPGSGVRVLVLALSFAACSDDEPADSEESTAGDFGTSTGVMTTSSTSLGGSSGSTAGTGGTSTTGASSSGTTGADTTGIDTTGTTGTDTSMDPGLHVLVTQIFSANSLTSYALVTESLGAAVALETSTAFELPGRALAFGIPGHGTFYVGGSDAPTITRFTVDDAGVLHAGEVISLASYGVATIGEYQAQAQVVSETVAYYFDGETARAVRWNPTAMTVDGAIDLAGLARAETVLTFSSAPPVRLEQHLFMPAAWRSADNTTIIPESAIVVLDSALGTATVHTDNRCGYAREAALGADGYIYVATEAYGAAVHVVAPNNATPPCLLRFDPATSSFDPAFVVDLNALSGAWATGSLLAAGPGEAFLRVLDPALVEVSGEVHPRVLASAPAWRWSALALGEVPSLTPLDALSPSNGSTFVWVTSDGRYAPEFAADRSQTTMLDLDTGARGVTVPGLVFSAVQLR